MKVVLFCGGQGLRIRDYSDAVPKPMVPVGFRPILWHLMKYYAHFGHNEFIICLGHKADVVKSYFRNYDETVTNDFVLNGDGKVELLNSDIHSWKITFVDTGMESNIGQRLLRVKKFLKDDELFLANYSDQVSDLPLNSYIEHFKKSGKTASLVTVRPPSSFHIIHSKSDGLVDKIEIATKSDIWVNGGFFVFKNEIFNYINEGDELVVEPFDRLMKEKKLLAYQYDGFWACMDTFKEKQRLDDLHARGNAPWEMWKRQPNPETGPSAVAQLGNSKVK